MTPFLCYIPLSCFVWLPDFLSSFLRERFQAGFLPIVPAVFESVVTPAMSRLRIGAPLIRLGFARYPMARIIHCLQHAL